MFRREMRSERGFFLTKRMHGYIPFNHNCGPDFHACLSAHSVVALTINNSFAFGFGVGYANFRYIIYYRRYLLKVGDFYLALLRKQGTWEHGIGLIHY